MIESGYGFPSTCSSPYYTLYAFPAYQVLVGQKDEGCCRRQQQWLPSHIHRQAGMMMKRISQPAVHNKTNAGLDEATVVRANVTRLSHPTTDDCF